MTYLVFALIVAAAAIYLYFSELRVAVTATLPVGEKRRLLLERQQTIRLSLKDIEYETSVGKMDQPTATRLQSELLSEWQSIEAEIPNLAEIQETPPGVRVADKCKSCNTPVVSAAARFCHVCGARLHQLLLVLLLIFCLAPNRIEAFDILVTVQNGTSGGVYKTPLSIQLLKLEQGMQPLSAANTANGVTRFTGLPEMTAGPYMVQTSYQGVTYSKVIAPNMASPAAVNLEIFESTDSTAKLRARTLVEVRRVDKELLAGLMIVYFINSDRRTFRGGASGLEFYLPPKATVAEASVSVGSGASNIQWLKITASKGAQPGQYFVAQSVKPGERILQVAFQMPYDEKATAFALRTVYPQDAGIQLIAEPQNLTVSDGAKELARIQDKNLGRGVISFPSVATQVNLQLKGGGIAETRQEESAEVEVKSPLELWQKLLFPGVAVLLFGLVAMLRMRRGASLGS
jgi:hypothetical protein